MMLVELPLRDLLIRPPAFMAVSRVIAFVFGPSEGALRALPWCAGLAALGFAPMLARRLYSAPSARLLFVAVIALHPAVTSFTKEFKPYEVSFTLHLLLVLLTLRYVTSGTSKDLGWLLVGAFVGGPFAQDLVFAYPGVFLVAGYEAFRRRRRHLPALAIAVVAILAVLAAQYFLIWSQLAPSESEFWAKKYKIFYAEPEGSYGGWFLERYQGLAAFPGFQRTTWNFSWVAPEEMKQIREVGGAVWVVLHVTGVLAMLARRRFRELLLLFLPIVLCFAFNVLGKWPFGVFRTNLFLAGYTAAIAAMALDWRTERFRVFSALFPATLLVIAPLLFLQEGWGPPKHGLAYNSRFSEAVVWLAKQAAARRVRDEPLLIDRRSCDSFRYYVYFNPRLAPFRRRLEKAFVVTCIDRDPQMPRVVAETLESDPPRFWVLFNLRQRTRQALDEFGRVRKTTARVDVSPWSGTPFWDGHSAVAFERAR
jgi:hypothetical protein